jgi:tripartite-type tricarboxylate transporter receptor subunit TctC
MPGTKGIAWVEERPMWKLTWVGLVAALSAGFVAATNDPLAAQDRYPNRPVRIVVPFPAGGPIDVMARLVGQKLAPTLGQVVIENRPGGGSTIGLKAAVTAEPDGHTLLFGGLMTLSVLPTMSRTLGIDPLNGFAPIAAVSGTPFVLVVPPRVTARTVQELIAYARANPGKVNFGAPAGATPIMVGELFKLRTGINIVTVPYRGAANVMTDMLSGQIDMSFEPTSITLAHVRDGKVRPLAVTGEARSSELPQVPTMAESGVPDMVAVSWTGLVAPPRTPPAIVERLNQAVNAALKSDDMIVALRKLGSSPLGGSPQDFRNLLTQESPKWLAVVKSSGIKFD